MRFWAQKGAILGKKGAILGKKGAKLGIGLCTPPPVPQTDRQTYVLECCVSKKCNQQCQGVGLRDGSGT